MTPTRKKRLKRYRKVAMQITALLQHAQYWSTSFDEATSVLFNTTNTNFNKTLIEHHISTSNKMLFARAAEAQQIADRMGATP